MKTTGAFFSIDSELNYFFTDFQGSIIFSKEFQDTIIFFNSILLYSPNVQAAHGCLFLKSMNHYFRAERYVHFSFRVEYSDR